MAGFETLEMDRRSLFRGALLVGVAVTTSVIAAESPAQAEDGDAKPLPYPQPKTLEQAQINKTEAEARKAAEEAEKLRLDNEASQQTPPADPLDARKKQAEVEKLEKDAEGDPWWKGLIPDTAAVTAAIGGVWVVGKYLKDKRDTAEKDRQERRDKELAAEDARFDEIATRLLTSESPAEWKGGDVSLLSFVGEGHNRFRERVIVTTTALLRDREVAGPAPGRPESEYQNLFTAFMGAAEPVRGELVRQQEDRLRALSVAGQSMRAPFTAIASWEPVIDANGVVLAGLQLSRTNLSLLNLDGASFRGARLNLGIISGGSLRGADFTAAEMCGVYISNVDCSNSMMINTNLDGARLVELDYSRFDVCAAASVRGMIVDGTRGLSPARIATLRARGAEVLEREDYGPLMTGPGDSRLSTAPGDS